MPDQYGLLAARPSRAPAAGYPYFASDTQELFLWTGGLWEKVSFDRKKVAVLKGAPITFIPYPATVAGVFVLGSDQIVIRATLALAGGGGQALKTETAITTTVVLATGSYP